MKNREQSMNKKEKIVFKRKKNGGDCDWGQGLDYLLKPFWEELDKFVEDNYYFRHKAKRIDFLFKNSFIVLEKSKKAMGKACLFGNKNFFSAWVKKLADLADYGKKSRKLNQKAVFIDAVSQFLRESYLGDPPVVLGKPFQKSKISGKIKGIPANKSNSIKGKIKIILRSKNFSKFKKGKILVTDETDSSFLPLMEKAKGIITDKGGILCHAAIASRELKLPCITGTQNATKLLKNGDLVEMDMKNGEIRILKRD